MITKNHHQSLLNTSPWPMMSSFTAFNFLSSCILMMKGQSLIPMVLSMMTMAWSSATWWVTASKELKNGMHSMNLEKSFKSSMIFFISSEVLFFFSLFWVYFHFFLSPVMDGGMQWPPVFTKMFEYMNVPLMNTLVLVTSGVTITLAHQAMVDKNKTTFDKFKLTTLMLGIMFTYMQAEEYKNSFFSMSDGNFGNIFFVLTGFHGIHVIVGSIYLLVNILQSKNVNISKESLSFEMAAWYWHFVDVVWLCVFYILYYQNY